MIRHFSLNAWKPVIGTGYGDVNLFGFGLDWYHGGSLSPYFAIDAHLLGFGASLVFWPKGKDFSDVPVESLGREHGA